MLTLSYGFKKPQTGDKGSVFFPALEDDIQQLNDHTHDGSDTPRLNTTSVAAVTDSILAAGWVAQGDGVYRQAVTLPGGLLFGEINFSFQHATLGHVYALGVEKITGSSYYVYCTDNTLSFTAIYT